MAMKQLAVAHHVERLGALEQLGHRPVASKKLLEALLRAPSVVEAFALHHHAHAGHALVQRDEPDPIARVAEVVGAQHSAGVAHPCAPPVATESIDVGHLAKAAPHARHRVGLFHPQALLLGQHRGAAAGVDQPAAAKLLAAIVAAQLEAVVAVVIAQADVAHFGA
jgi:hypothetical protein